MNSHPRIMLVEPNRYRALLMQRTLEQHDRAAIVVRFSDPDQALSELSRNRYTAVIVNIDSLPGSGPGFLQSAAGENPGAHLVALTSGGTSAEESDKLARSSQCHLVHINDTVELLASLPGLSGSSPEESDWQPVKSGSTRLSGLIVAGQ
jgi:DNA-binding NarL/FixJ family response regulator